MLNQLKNTIQSTGFSFIKSNLFKRLLTVSILNDWPAFVASWQQMPLDEYMADGGRYRRRRHAVLSANHEAIQLEPHQPHFQSRDYNNLNGGIPRLFDAIPRVIVQGETFQTIVNFCNHIFSDLSGHKHWHIEAHQFRIEASQQQHGNPTPEGVHRDGVDYVLVMMVKRENISSGTTEMFNLNKQLLGSFTLTEALDCAFVDDHRCFHGVTPVEQIDVIKPAFRDVLVITFKKINVPFIE